MNAFAILLKKYLDDANPYLKWEKIESIDDSVVTQHCDLQITDNERTGDLENKVCIVKLNGGLGTTMGCTGPKSLMEIKDNYTFMDIIIEQSNLFPKIPLVLMNSFYTHEQTNQYLAEKQLDNLNIVSFNQNCYPRIIKETKSPLDHNSNNKDHMYPPGHGDLLQSLNDTGTLDKLIESGIEYAFIANSDNLGATMDFNILNDLIKHDIDFALELTPKTLNDVKGGTLIKYDGKYVMFEVAQCPPDKLSEFTLIEKFKYFNTNNVWIKLSAIKELIDTDYLNHIDVIINHKKLKDGRDCVQLEYAIGSLVKFFNKVKCYSVSRDRFIPVKNNNDLALVRSDSYILNKETWKLSKTYTP